MINNIKANKFIENANSALKAHLAINSTLKFTQPSYAEIEERIMRLGIEARALDLTTQDELESVALATLKNDFIKYN